MFGFLRPSRSFRVYRQAYARVCQIQHKTFGISTLPVLSYEGVALYLLCYDAGQVREIEAEEPVCCRLRVNRETLKADSNEIAKYCAAAGVLLLETKLIDDIRDSGSWLARAGRFWFRRRFQQARQQLSQADASTLSRIEEQIEEHLAAEQMRSANLEKYSSYTGNAFGELFSGVTELFPETGYNQRSEFHGIGSLIGRALIMFDCAADWWKDARRGDFNPVRNFAEAELALQKSADSLLKAAAIARKSFGDESLLSRLLVTRAESLLGRVITPSSCRSEIEKRGFTKEPGYTYAYCDGCDCDCGGCDGLCECIGGCGDCAGEADLASGACIPCFLPGECCCICYEPECFGDGKKKKSSGTGKRLNPDATEEDAVPSIIGQKGITLTPLSPSGIISIDGERHSASSSHGFIEANQEIVVQDVAAYGLIVGQPSEENSHET